MSALIIRNLRKRYATDVEALKGIDLTVNEGDFFALLGPNGAGKSTTIGIISDLVRPSGGEVRVFGHDLQRDPEAAKLEVGLVPQEFNFSLFETVLQIVVNQAGYYGVPRPLALQRAEKYLTQLGLWDKREARARTLSGGMKRRLMIARALMHEPRLLILDEPTAGVDIELRRSMWQFLKQINNEGKAIILTTHYLEEAEMLCRNIAIIDQGRIIENTSVKALLASLNLETFILDLAPSCGAVAIEGFVSRRIDDHTLEVDVAKAQGINPLFSQLSAQGVQVLSLRNKANRLEELFVHLVEQGKGEVAL